MSEACYNVAELWARDGPRLGRRVRGVTMPTSIFRDEVQRLIAEENAQLVEVLPAAEFEDEHIAGAINIPLRDLDRESAGDLDRDRPVIVY